MEACSGLWGDERQECLAVFGVDARSCDTFYSTVYSLEQALTQDTGARAHMPAGWMHEQCAGRKKRLCAGACGQVHAGWCCLPGQ